LSRMSAACTRNVLSSENGMVDLAGGNVVAPWDQMVATTLSRSILDITI
jgi:hypothetical protein